MAILRQRHHLRCFFRMPADDGSRMRPLGCHPTGEWSCRSGIGVSKSGLASRAAAPGEEAVVLEAGLAVGERGAAQGLDAAAGGFENGLAGRGIPFHRRAEARVEIALAGRDDAEFQRAAATLARLYRIILQELGQAPAVFVRAAMDDNEPVCGRARMDQLRRATAAAAGRRARTARGVGQPDRGPMHDAEYRPPLLDKRDQYRKLGVPGDELASAVE